MIATPHDVRDRCIEAVARRLAIDSGNNPDLMLSSNSLEWPTLAHSGEPGVPLWKALFAFKASFIVDDVLKILSQEEK